MNGNLPVAGYRQQIMEAVKNNPVVIITAETGAGKSTQIPQYLLDEGYDIVVTQPRRLAARTVSERVAEEYGCRFGGTVGYRTAYERQDSEETRCLFVTDGLALVRELMGAGRHQVLVLDEVHEWNLNMEVLVAWSKRQVEVGADFKLVVMSATMEAEKLSQFFNNAPVIYVPGRLFPVEEMVAKGRMVDDVADLLRQGRNVLVFQPGKKEIGDTVSDLKSVDGLNAEILPLHGELDYSAQAKCFRHFGRPKCVISTNVAQTSVTIDDIDAVVDSGMERRVELVSGVEGLYLRPISLADRSQRKGRAGRTKVGVYLDYCPVAWGDRLEFPMAEVHRTRLDQTVLRLAEAGIDMEELAFFHQPPVEKIRKAKQALRSLGCVDGNGRVTPIGRQVARLPISVQYGRMVVEAEKLGVVDDVVTVAAILEQREITARKIRGEDGNEVDASPFWRRLCPSETTSDVMAQLAVYKAAEEMTKDQMWSNGVFVKAFFQAKEKRHHLADALKGKVRNFVSSGKREDILRAICAGMVDHLFHGNFGSYRNGDDTERQLNRDSVISGGEWLVGIPFDLEVKTRRGGKALLHLVIMASKVEPEWLVEVAPQLVETKTGLNPRYDAEKDVVVSTTQTFFNSQMVREETVADGQHPEAVMVFARWLAGQCDIKAAEDAPAIIRNLKEVLCANTARQNLAKNLNVRTSEETFKVFSFNEVCERFVVALLGARRIVEITRPAALALPVLDEDKVASVLRDNPDVIVVLGEEVVVEYRPSSWGTVYPPRIRLDFRGERSREWLKLPDEGIHLPGGREVSMYSAVEGYGWYIEVESSVFKAKARECLNLSQWEQWKKPLIEEMPDPEISNSVIPFIMTVYGQCVVTGEDLVAYGTVAVNTSRWYVNDPWFKTVWSRDLAEAHTFADTAAKKLEELKAEVKAEAELEAEKARRQAKVESFQSLLSDLFRREKWMDLEYDFRWEAERHVRYLPSFTSEEEVKQWIITARVILFETEMALKQMEEEKEERKRLERAEYQELEVILLKTNDDLDVAREVKTFAETVEDLVGLTKEAILILRGELEAYYGRARRQSVISQRVPDLEGTDVGRTFLSFSRARDVDAWLAGAVAWLEAKLEKSEPTKKVTATIPATGSVDLSQVDLSKLFGGSARQR